MLFYLKHINFLRKKFFLKILNHDRIVSMKCNFNGNDPVIDHQGRFNNIS